MAAVIKNFRVVTLGLDNERLDLLWEFVVPADALRYEVWVERSGGAVGPFQILAKDYNAIAFTDFTVNRKSANIHYHYRLRVVPRDDPQESATVELTGVKALEPERDLVAAEIERRNNLLYQEYTAAGCWCTDAVPRASAAPTVGVRKSGSRPRASARPALTRALLWASTIPWHWL